MSRRESLVPVFAGSAVLLVAVLVVVLLRGAVSAGTEALEEAKVAQVMTTANSFDARVESTIGSIAGLGARPWELTLRSKADKATLNTFAIDPEAQSGNFLVDQRGRIVNGTLLRPGRLGSTYDAPGWAEAQQQLKQAPAVVLPVAPEGVTSELPAYAFVVAIRGAGPSSVRGAFVFEAALTTDSAFSQEIQALADRDVDTESWRFIDSQGRVVATTLPTGLGEQVEQEELTSLEPGDHEIGGQYVVSADVPSVGWQVVFTQDRDEFTGPLTDPLQSVGLLLVLLLVGVGLVLTLVLARRLRQAREERRRLLELNRSQEEFISVVSHELRTPVAGVMGFLQTSLDHWETMSDRERHNAVSRAFSNARRLQAMTRDVLDTESIESGRFGYVRHETDIADELRAAVDGIGTGEGELLLDLPDLPVVARVDADRIQQVLANLLDNARKNSPAGSPVRVALSEQGGTAQITVEDQGSGIDPAQLDRIFDKFVRGREGTVSGTGLGLYISRQIVEAHDGRIWAESPAGGPTRFVVELPVAAQEGRRIPAP